MAAWLTEGQTGQRFDPVRLHHKDSHPKGWLFLYSMRLHEPLTS